MVARDDEPDRAGGAPSLCRCAPANQLLLKVGQAPASTTKDADHPGRAVARERRVGDARAGTGPDHQPEPGVCGCHRRRARRRRRRDRAPPGRARDLDVHHRDRGVPGQEADAEGVAASPTMRKPASLQRSDRPPPPPRSRRPHPRAVAASRARHAADHGRRHGGAAARDTPLDDDTRPRRGAVDRRHDRVPGRTTWPAAGDAPGGRWPDARKALQAAEHGYHYQYGEGRAQGPRRPSPAMRAGATVAAKSGPSTHSAVTLSLPPAWLAAAIRARTAAWGLPA